MKFDDRHDAAQGSGPGTGGLSTIIGYLLVALVAVALVGGSWLLTRDRIGYNAGSSTRAMLAAVLPRNLYDNHPDEDVIGLPTSDGQSGTAHLLPVYRARRGKTPTAAALTMIAANGFGGPIKLVVGIAADGTVLGVTIIEQHETPGIGDQIERSHSSWLDEFTGRSLASPATDRWRLKKDGGDFDAIAGASVSSRAVLDGVRQAVEYFSSHKTEIFAPHDAD